MDELTGLNEFQQQPLTSELLTQLYSDISDRENYIGELRGEIKETFESFASSNGFDVKGVKEGYKFYKAMNKNIREAKTIEFLRDKIVDVLISGAVTE